MTSHPKSTADIIIFLSRVAALGSKSRPASFYEPRAISFTIHSLDNPKNLNPKSNSSFQ